MGEPRLFVPAGSSIRPFADSVAWLWRLGGVSDRPGPALVGIGSIDDAAELRARLAGRELAGVVVLGTRPGPDQGPLPGRSHQTGAAEIGGASVRGQLTTLQGPGQALASSSLGVHALRNGDWLTIGTDPIASWGTLRDHWALPPLADFLAERLGRPMAMLPPIGLVRWDDVPGTAPQQLKGQDKPDAKVKRRLDRVVGAYADAGAKINLAICARVLSDGAEAPPEVVFPKSIESIAAAISAGAVEPISHGWLHLEPGAHDRGEVEPREFGEMAVDEARRRIEGAIAWSEQALGVRPPTFVAPNWTYGNGLLAALDALQMPAWLPLRFGPLVDGRNAHETLVSTLNGLRRLDYSPLSSLAGVGLPPYVVIHGGLLDARFDTLDMPRDLPTLAKLAVRRDILRLPGVKGVSWVGASELMEAFRAHDEVAMDGAEIRAPDGVQVTLRRPAGAPV